MKKKVTMQDIADMCNVTKSTVSRYFNGGYVKQETKDKIAKVIEEYSYEPNTFARLKAKQSYIIGVIAPCLDSIVTSRVLMSIDEYFRNENYTTMIMNTDHNEELEINCLERLWRMNVDGIILNATHISEKHREMLKKIDIPIVVIAQGYGDGVCVINDDYNAGKFMGSYIGKKGHKHVAYIGVEEKDIAVGIIRKQGILTGLQNENVEDIEVVISDFSYEKAQIKIRELLNRKKVDAIICATDRMAFGAYKVCKEMKYRIPEDISIIGFGGYEESELLTPKLTTLRFQSKEGGKKCAETLLHMIRKEPYEKTHYIDFDFIEGESVKKRGM